MPVFFVRENNKLKIGLEPSSLASLEHILKWNTSEEVSYLRVRAQVAGAPLVGARLKR